MNIKKQVLIHARGRMAADEMTFWDELKACLAARDVGLHLMAHNRPQSDHEVPVLIVPNMLHNAPGEFAPWDGHTVASPCSSQREAELLEREVAWRGQVPAEMQARRKEGVRFFYEFYGQALRAVTPHVVLIWNGMHAQEMILDELSRNVGCRVGYIERAPIPGMIHLDWQDVLGGSSLGRATGWKWQSASRQALWTDRFAAIEKMLASGQSTWWEQPDRRDGGSLQEQLGIPEDRKVVLFAGQIDADAQNLFFSPHYESCADALRHFCSILESRDDVFVIGKHHPKSKVSVDVYREIVGDRGVWVDDVALADCLELCSHVAAVNSTLLYEGIMRGKPILSMGESLLSGKGIAYEVTDRESAERVMAEWLNVEGWDSRLLRWHDFAGWLLENAFFDFNMGECGAALRGPQEFAEEIAGELGSAASVAPLDSSDLLWGQVEAWKLGRRYVPCAPCGRIGGLLRRILCWPRSPARG